MSDFAWVDHQGHTQHYHEKGYVVVRNVISKSNARDLRQQIENKIDVCAKQLGCIKEDYLSYVSRWVDPSPMTSHVSPSILEKLSQAAQTLIKRPVFHKKMNVICKNAFSNGPIAYHQDISYSPHDPYEFSMWVALNDISLDSGPLEVIPSSHLFPLKPAVDFWSPNYEPDPSLQVQAVKLILEEGDAVFFDSRLWHGSGENTDLSSRYALVIRWFSEGWQFKQTIPPIEPDSFGLWTCGRETEDILVSGLNVMFNRSESDFIKILDIWMQYLQESSLPFVVDISDALESFKGLKVLHLSHVHHNGGDATGSVYKNIWEKFLSPLNDYVSELEKKGRFR